MDKIKRAVEMVDLERELMQAAIDAGFNEDEARELLNGEGE